jgi:transcriptional antiterminator RfaH
VVPTDVVEALRREVGERELRVVARAVAVGDEVQVTAGPMAGLLMVVQQVLPARERVRVLLDFLGRQVVAEVAVAELTTEWKHPLQRG